MYEPVFKRQMLAELLGALEATRAIAENVQRVLVDEMLTAKGLRRVEASEASWHLQLLLVQLSVRGTEEPDLVRCLKECAAGMALPTERRAVL